MTPARHPETERRDLIMLIERILREAPRRQPTSRDERRAQEIVEEYFQAQGLRTEWHPFRFNDNLYANLALHFGLGTVATIVSAFAPAVALVLHLLAAVSYWADSTRRFYLLRRLLGFKPSQNLLATLPARGGTPRLRVVIAAHADAAFTGLMFEPRVAGLVARRPMPGPLGRTLALAVIALFALAGVDLIRLLVGTLPWPVVALEALLTLPAAGAFLLGLDIVLRRKLVPGANDDLTGVAALPALARRLAANQPEDLELVFAVTGCEEASMGGADALARDLRGRWSRENTVFLALDGLTNGELRFMEREGEVAALPVPRWLVEACERVASASPELGPVRAFQAPVGGTDAAAFLAHGYDAGALLCIDEAFGTPREYHQPSDTAELLDRDQLAHSVEFAERLVREIIASRLGRVDRQPDRVVS